MMEIKESHLVYHCLPYSVEFIDNLMYSFAFLLIRYSSWSLPRTISFLLAITGVFIILWLSKCFLWFCNSLKTHFKWSCLVTS